MNLSKSIGISRHKSILIYTMISCSNLGKGFEVSYKSSTSKSDETLRFQSL